MRPMSLEDFRQLEDGQEVWLSYHAVNSGRFKWRHKAVKDDRVIGQFQYADASGWSKVGDYLYESQCRGTRCVCRGSGAEPVHREEDDQ